MVGSPIGRLPFGAHRPLAVAAADGARHRGAPGPLPDDPAAPPTSFLAGAAMTAGDPCFAHLVTAVTTAFVGPAHALSDALAVDAEGWCPTYRFGSRVEAYAALSGAEDSLAVQRVEVDHLWWLEPVAIVPWRLVASVDEPLLVADDLLVEPSARPVVLDGVSIAELVGGQVTSIWTTFDDAVVIEQVVLRPAPLV